MRYSIFILFIFCGCKPSPRPSGQWLGRVPYETFTYRMFLDASTSIPRLVNVSFKANEVPMDTIYFDRDSLHFSFEEFYTTFKGVYQQGKNQIEGEWITEDRVKIPVTFVFVHPDTVFGLHPRNEKSYSYQPPTAQMDQWPVCPMEDQQMNSLYIDSLMHEIIEERFPDMHSVLIARNNCLVVEEYFYTFNRDFRQNIQSVTKSFVSALAGIAIGKGEIRHVNETLCTRFPSHQPLVCNSQNRDITLRQLLSMSSGLEWDEATYDYVDPRNSAAIAGDSEDPFAYVLSQRRPHPGSFRYNSYNHLMMNAVLKRATGLDNATEMRMRLLSPLGMASFYLGEEDHGVIGDIELRPRDMIKLGQLYLNEGRWNEEQIIPTDWVRESTTSKIEAVPGIGYGYFWWTTQFKADEKLVDAFFAWGYGGQYIIVVPELKLVVGLTGSHWGTDPKNYVFQMMEEYILPACQ